MLVAFNFPEDEYNELYSIVTKILNENDIKYKSQWPHISLIEIPVISEDDKKEIQNQLINKPSFTMNKWEIFKGNPKFGNRDYLVITLNESKEFSDSFDYLNDKFHLDKKIGTPHVSLLSIDKSDIDKLLNIIPEIKEKTSKYIPIHVKPNYIQFWKKADATIDHDSKEDKSFEIADVKESEFEIGELEEKILYHGTDETFSKFKIMPPKTGHGWGKGVYLTNKGVEASRYAGSHEGSQVHIVDLDLNKLKIANIHDKDMLKDLADDYGIDFELEFKGKKNITLGNLASSILKYEPKDFKDTEQVMNDIRMNLLSKGYDGLYLPIDKELEKEHPVLGDNYVIYDPEKIKHMYVKKENITEDWAHEVGQVRSELGEINEIYKDFDHIYNRLFDIEDIISDEQRDKIVKGVERIRGIVIRAEDEFRVITKSPKAPNRNPIKHSTPIGDKKKEMQRISTDIAKLSVRIRNIGQSVDDFKDVKTTDIAETFENASESLRKVFVQFEKLFTESVWVLDNLNEDNEKRLSSKNINILLKQALDYGEENNISTFLRLDKAGFSEGDILRPSRVWDDGEPTDEILDGTSCFGDYLKGNIAYWAEQAYIVTGENIGEGNDRGEVIVKNCEIIKPMDLENKNLEEAKKKKKRLKALLAPFYGRGDGTSGATLPPFRTNMSNTKLGPSLPGPTGMNAPQYGTLPAGPTAPLVSSMDWDSLAIIKNNSKVFEPNADKELEETRENPDHKYYSIPKDSKVVKIGTYFGIDEDNRKIYRIKGYFLVWDSRHGDWEVFDSWKYHLGSTRDNKKEIYKPAVTGRKLNVK